MDFEDLFNNKRNHDGERNHHQEHDGDHYPKTHREYYRDGQFDHQKRGKPSFDWSNLTPIAQKLFANKPLLITVIAGAFLLLGITLALLVLTVLFVSRILFKTNAFDWHSLIHSLGNILGLVFTNA